MCVNIPEYVRMCVSWRALVMCNSNVFLCVRACVHVCMTLLRVEFRAADKSALSNFLSGYEQMFTCFTDHQM